jgi:nucleotide-binding universal stress UspA family protein
MAAKPIVAGTDGSEESLRAVDWARHTVSVVPRAHASLAAQRSA